jgi:hypothetical protein
MSDFKRHMNSGYAGCRLLAYARDNHRNRDVKIFQIPHEWEAVGVSDGVDSWIAPVIADPFSVNIKRLMADLQAGKPLPTPVPPDKAQTAPPQLKKARVALLEENAPKRVRVRIEEAEPAAPAKPARKRIN